MGKTIYRVLVEKDAVTEDSKKLKIVENLREWLQDKLFEYLDSVNKTEYAKSHFYETAMKMGLEDAEIPSEEEIREAVKVPCCEDEGFGWNYSVNEESLCVTGILELLAPGIKPPIILSWASLDQVPGIKFSQEIINDKNPDF